jgi:hypothetical protein
MAWLGGYLMGSLASVVPRLDDKTALDTFRELQNFLLPQSMSLQGAGLDGIDLLNPNEAAVKVLAALEKPNSYLITHISLNYQNFSISFVRNQDPNRLSPFYDEIRIEHGGGGMNQNQRLALVKKLNSRLSLGSVHRRDEVASKSIEDLQAIYHSTILKLETSFADQIEKITKWTVDQTTALEQHKLKLAEDTAAERERLRKDYDAKAEGLRRETEELDVKRRQLDDRTHMHARRGLRTDLQRTIKERQQKFTVTPETRLLRVPVHVAMIALLFGLAAVNYAAIQAILGLDLEKATLPVLAWTFGKQTLVTLAFVGVLFFYVRWMNRWFEQHASAEFLLKQFELDIDRASWVVETAMEWRREQQTEIPAPLLEGITRNLFSDRNDTTSVHSAADDLASALVGNASQVKLKIGENEVSLDRKGLAGLGKADVPGWGHLAHPVAPPPPGVHERR